MKDRARRYLTVLIFGMNYVAYLNIQSRIWLDAEITCVLDDFCEFYRDVGNFWHILMGCVIWLASVQIAAWIEEIKGDDD